MAIGRLSSRCTAHDILTPFSSDAAPFVGPLWDFEGFPREEITQRHNNFYEDLWREAFSEPNYLAHFGEPEEEVIKYTYPYTIASWTDFVMTGSWVAVMSDEQKELVKKVVRDNIEKGDGVQWLDKEKGIWAHPYKSEVVVFRRK